MRVLPLDARYAGRIHEQPTHEHQALPTGLMLGHDGYLPEPNERKRGRNERLLRSALEQRPHAYLTYQLAKDLEVQGRFVEAAYHYTVALDLTPHVVPWRHALVTRASHTLTRSSRHDEGLALFDQESQRWHDSPDLFFAAGDLFLDMTVVRPRGARVLLDLARRCWTRCLEIGERPDLAGAVSVRGSDLARHNLEVVGSVYPDSGGSR